MEYNNANKPKVDARQHGDALSNYQYYYKPAGYPNNYTNAFGWAFHMTTVINSDTNKTALLCDHDGQTLEVIAFDKAKSNNAVIHSGEQMLITVTINLGKGQFLPI